MRFGKYGDSTNHAKIERFFAKSAMLKLSKDEVRHQVVDELAAIASSIASLVRRFVFNAGWKLRVNYESAGNMFV